MENIYEEFVERLSLQISSFQEGFKILANSLNLSQMGENFAHILRGSLLLVDLNIFYRESNEENWKPIYKHNQGSDNFLEDLDNTNGFNLIHVEDKNYRIKILMPLNDGSHFALFLGDKLDKSKYSDIDRIVIQIFMQLLDNGYQALKNHQREKELIFSLNNKVLQLNSLIDTGIEISKLKNINNLLELALERAIALTNASAGTIEVFENGISENLIKIPDNLSPDFIESAEFKISSNTIFHEKKYYLTLYNKESRTGYVEFDTTDDILLSAFVRQIHAAIENEFLLKESIAKENIQRELEVASSIQKKIIPEVLPEIQGYKIAGINIPSKEVGGDYFDVVELNDKRIAMIIADVTGKGVPAALLVSTLNALIKSYLDFNISPEELAIKVNSAIYKATPLDKFITFFMAVLTPETGELDIINAGHNPSLLLRVDGTIQKIEAGGVAFGMFDMGLPFSGEKLVIEKGERLLLFTDGIPEAMNKNDEEYSDEKLEDFFKSNLHEDPTNFINDIVDDVKNFAGETPQSDDITAIYLIRN